MANSVDMSTLIDIAWQGWIVTAWTILNWPIGWIIFLVWGLLILMILAWIVIWIFRFASNFFPKKWDSWNLSVSKAMKK